MRVCVRYSTPISLRNSSHVFMLMNYKQRAHIAIVLNIYSLYVIQIIMQFLNPKTIKIACKFSISLQTGCHVHFITNLLDFSLITVFLLHLTMKLDTLLMNM